MKIIRRPSVYLVGRQAVDGAELRRFLADHDVVDWTTDTEVAAQVLPELAGRLCYMSFAKPRPGGNRTYLGHI
jgi:thymidylate synthase (FAD)